MRTGKVAVAQDAAVSAHIVRLFHQAGGACVDDLREVREWVVACSRIPGARLRLLSLVCEAAGGDPSRAIPAVAAWHLLDCAADLLDDTVGAEPLPRVCRQAADAAIALVFLAQLSLTTLKESRIDPDCIIALVGAFNARASLMARGDTARLAWDARSATRDEYLRGAGTRRGRLLALACHAGALLGTDDQTEIDRYTTFGYHLGVLVQVADDLQALWKPRGRSDLLTAGRALPVVYALSVAAPEGREHLHHLLANAPDSAEARHELLVELARLGALHYVALQGGLRHQLAREAILSAPRPTAAHEELIGLLEAAFPAVVVVDKRCEPSRLLDG